MAAPKQHKPGTTSKNRKTVKIGAVDLEYVFSGRLGKAHAEEIFLCVDADEFFREYLPGMEFDDVYVQFSSETPPTPEHVALQLLSSKGSRYQKLCDFESFLQDASDVEILEMMQRTRAALPAPTNN